MGPSVVGRPPHAVSPPPPGGGAAFARPLVRARQGADLDDAELDHLLSLGLLGELRENPHLTEPQMAHLAARASGLLDPWLDGRAELSSALLLPLLLVMGEQGRLDPAGIDEVADLVTPRTPPRGRAAAVLGVLPTVPPPPVPDLVLDLVQSGVHLVLVGGLAGALLGAPWTPGNVDLVYEDTPDTHQHIARVLHRYQDRTGHPWRHRHPQPGESAEVASASAPGLWARHRVTLDHGALRLDFHRRLCGVGGYAACRAASTPVVLGALSVPVLTLPALMAVKWMAGRDKDRAQLLELCLVRDALGSPPPGPGPAGSQAAAFADTVRRRPWARLTDTDELTLDLVTWSALARAARDAGPAMPPALVTRRARLAARIQERVGRARVLYGHDLAPLWPSAPEARAVAEAMLADTGAAV